ncbi:MAG: hypothetical protein H7138_01110 [Myxococcales bacterium]|nr:hypothetical protein [Myxococcales bacterium]
MTPEAQQLDLLAATQIIADSEVAQCWELIRVGIQTHKVGTGNLRRLISHLRAGNGMTLDELTIEVEASGSDRVVVSLLDDERTCSASRIIEELESLAGRAGATSPAGSPSSGGGAPSGVPPNTSAAGADASDLLGLLAGLLGTTPERLTGDPSAYRAHVERVRAAATRWREAVADPSSDATTRSSAEADLRTLLFATADQAAVVAASRTRDLQGTVQTLGVDPDRVAGALRTIADWLEQRTPTAGALVDRLVAALDAAAAPFLGQVTPAAADADRDQRIRASAREEIAARIKPSGFGA